MVPAAEICRWIGVEQTWVEGLALSGQLESRRDNGTLLIDPLDLSSLLRGGTHTPEVVSAARVDALRLASLELASQDAPASVCNELLAQLKRVVDTDSIAVYLVMEATTLRFAASEGNRGSNPGRVVEAIATWTVESGEPLILTDPRRISESPSDAKDPRDTVAIPFLVDEHPVGTVVLTRGLDYPPFADAEIALASVLCTEAGLAIERIRTQHGLQQRIDELRLSEGQLEAYARDIRETFAAEKQRAEQLAGALSELEETYLATVKGLAAAVEAKDEYTAGHIVRVTRYALMIMRLIAPKEADDPQFEYGFMLHDVGKLTVPDAVLGKNGPLTEDEWVIMRLHPETGRRILDDIPFLRDAKEIVYAHHERWDGRGYPRGLKGEEIPLGARAFPLADSFDAMTSDRPYRRALPLDKALDEIREGAGTQFWPEAVKAFLSIPVKELDEVRTGATMWNPLARG